MLKTRHNNIKYTYSGRLIRVFIDIAQVNILQEYIYQYNYNIKENSL